MEELIVGSWGVIYSEFNAGFTVLEIRHHHPKLTRRPPSTRHLLPETVFRIHDLDLMMANRQEVVITCRACGEKLPGIIYARIMKWAGEKADE